MRVSLPLQAADREHIQNGARWSREAGAAASSFAGPTGPLHSGSRRVWRAGREETRNGNGQSKGRMSQTPLAHESRASGHVIGGPPGMLACVAKGHRHLGRPFIARRREVNYIRPTGALNTQCPCRPSHATQQACRQPLYISKPPLP